MSSLLRSRVALFGLAAAFLIPVTSSSFRGLTHVLTCRDEIRTPFTLSLGGEDGPVVATSTRIGIGDEDTLCDGLRVELGARQITSRSVVMTVPIANTSAFPWRGTVHLRLEDLLLPVDVGEVSAGQTVTDRVELTLSPGEHALEGALLVGP